HPDAGSLKVARPQAMVGAARGAGGRAPPVRLHEGVGRAVDVLRRGQRVEGLEDAGDQIRAAEASNARAAVVRPGGPAARSGAVPVTGRRSTLSTWMRR